LGAVAGLSGGALVLVPSGGFDASVDPEGFVAAELPAGGVLDGTGVGLEGGTIAGCCAAGCASGVIDEVVVEFVGAGVTVDPAEGAGDSDVPGCSSVIAGFFDCGFNHPNPWFFQRK